jgi:hypothetical protein
MRWLCVPNEPYEGFQIGMRMAFEKLHREGVFTEYMAYSFIARQRELKNDELALNEFLATAKGFAPDVIFISHPGWDYPLTSDFIKQLKNISSKPKLIYYEEDPYGYFIKRMNGAMRALLSESDICFMSGTGYLAELALRAGAKKIRYALHSYDSQRFGTPWQPTLTRQLDAVMIANLPCLKKIPWLHVPGGWSRKRTARLFYKYLDDRFAVYGGDQGWAGTPYCKGRVAFDKQEEIIRNSWMSVNWGQYDEIPMYSSDRLPISLACGVPHITNYQPGYEHVYNNVPGLFVIKSPHEALDVALYLLSLPVERRNELGFEAGEYARKYLEGTVVFGNMARVVLDEFFVEYRNQIVRME